MTLQRNKSRGPVFGGIFVIVLVIGSGAVFRGQGLHTSALNDPVALLQKQIERGEVKLDYSAGGWGYLPSVLNHLGINVDSQILVFSKTSLQFPKISPKTPRAIYFNDNVAVGYVQEGSVYEFTSLDPSQGLIFYTMDTQKTETPRFERKTNECLMLPRSVRRPGSHFCFSIGGRHAAYNGDLFRRRRSSDPDRAQVGRMVRFRNSRVDAPYG